jgi:hypothetical protein
MVDAREAEVFERPGPKRVEENTFRFRCRKPTGRDLLEERFELGSIHG